jgi:hypothetical protein
LPNQKLRDINKKMHGNHGDWTTYSDKSNEDWLETILPVKGEIEIMQTELRVWLERLDKMIAKKVFTDFSTFRFDSPLPNLLVWLRTGKLFNVQHMLEAHDGHWEQGVAGILRQIEFCKLTQKGSTVLLINLIGKALMTHSLQALSSIMNQKDCPESVYKQILAGLPAISFAEFSCGNTLIAEIFSFQSFLAQEKNVQINDSSVIQRLLPGWFLQKNRTLQMMMDRTIPFIALEKIPPYQWSEPQTRTQKYPRGWFWWLQNPAGKLLLGEEGMVGMAIVKSYRAKTYYDMVRIAAELHLNYTADKPVESQLESLNSYRSPDPFSGKPYRWNEQKQVLYSLGNNRQDDGGLENNATLDKDFVMPCILYVKTKN